MDFPDFRRGDTLSFEGTVRDQTGAAVDVTNANFWFTVKYKISDTDIVAIYQGTELNGGVLIVDAVNGIINPVMPPSATIGFPDYPIRCIHDTQMKDEHGFVQTIDSGTVTVNPDVTRAT